MRLDLEPRFDRRSVVILIVAVFLLILAVRWIHHQAVENPKVTLQPK
jgi:hypothetical protein